MAKMAAVVLCLIMACMVVVAPYAEAISCVQVVSALAPCFGYLTKGGPVPPACCGGVRGLNNAAKTTPDRQTTCGCLKSVYASNSGINLGFASSLPGKCGVNVPFKISPSTDCAKVH
ncbi:putative plant non-specific lipid-transfer protein/Par allergen [Helianthus debilis subsp. tardiflorus]